MRPNRVSAITSILRCNRRDRVWPTLCVFSTVSKSDRCEIRRGEGASGGLSPPEEHGILFIIAPIGIFYSNTVGASGVSSAGRNWDRQASAAHRWAPALVGDKVFLSIISDNVLVLAGDDIPDMAFLAVNSPLMISGYPISEEKVMGGDDLV